MTSITISRLATPDIPATADIIVDAFATEALTSYWIDLGTVKVREHYAGLLRSKLRDDLRRGEPLLAARTTTSELPVGVAVIQSGDHSRSRLRTLFAVLPLLRHLPGVLPGVQWRSLIHLPEVRRAMEPPESIPSPHQTLEILGVRPDQQGRGVGTALLEAVHRQSVASGLEGTYLITAELKTRAIYHHLGYDTRAIRQVGPLDIYHMYRPSRPGAIVELHP